MAGQTQRRTQSERSEESTRRMMQAATELIAEQGFMRTTVPQIAERAGYSHGLVMQRFGSKSELIRLLALEFQSYFRYDKLTPAFDHRQGVRALVQTIETYVDAVAASGTLGRAYYELFGESIALVPEIHDTFVAADRSFRRFFERSIRAAVDSGELPPEVDSGALASLALAIVRGLSIQWLLDAGGLDLDSVKREVRRLFELAVPGLRGV
jgi:AcrR family transcriptional regulator